MSSQWMLIDYQNPEASPGKTLTMPIVLLPNTPEQVLREHVMINSAKPLTWLHEVKGHDRVAVMVGGGPSVAEHVDAIRAHAASGATIFAMNAASQWLRGHNIEAHWQVMCDAQRETRELVDPLCASHLFGSHVHPFTVDRAPEPVLWHAMADWVEDELPQARRRKGNYALIGGGASVGNSAMCVAYAMGYRRFEVYGFDSSHRGTSGHAYAQPMNDNIQVLPVPFDGRMYWATITMRAQAERFQLTAQTLKQHGCTVEVHGDGLLPAMWRANAGNSEREKYQRMWGCGHYRTTSPGENLVPVFLELLDEPPSSLIDFGCGPGRASVALQTAGFEVLALDFTDNSRDADTRHVPFLEWDITKPIPASARWGYCTDVLEHLPPGDVDAAITNIMTSVETAFVQVACVHDNYGAIIGQILHLTVEPHAAWRARFERLGYAVSYDVNDTDQRSQFIITRV